MKKLLFLGLAIALVAAMPLTHDASAAKPDSVSKTWLCHITGENDTGTRYVGHVIYVSDNAVKAHCDPKKGVADHNPAGGNREVGNDCSRRIKRRKPAKCEVGG